MKIWFDPRHDCFCHEQWFPVQPEGTTEISGELHAELMAAQDDGKVITHDDSGNPVARELPVPVLTREEHIALAGNQRQALLSQADSITADWRVELMLDVISDADRAKLQQWMDYKRKVKEVDISAAPDVHWPETPA
ncbi:tail fiber assembly protein [Cronobacter dublinensis]|nr:tail fiber assembly protein [Cronobacter dublinensis]ELY2819339.1 tail fiber assembly protein [Cronobacter dublinensis]